MPKGGHNKLSYEYVYDLFKENGYSLKSKEYKNNSSKLEVVCPKGHTWYVSLASFKSGNRCPYCYSLVRGQKRRLSFSDVRKFFEKEGYQLLSDESEYKTVETKLRYKCPNGHYRSITFHNFKSGQRCPECSKYKNTKHTITDVKEIFSKEGYKLLTKDYSNNRQKLDVICPQGHNWKTTLHDFIGGNRCSVCWGERRGLSRRLSYEYVKSEFEKEGYTLLTDHYDNIYQLLDVICPNGHSWKVNIANFKNNHVRCPKCPTHNSKDEIEIYNYLKKQFTNITSGDRSLIPPLELDIVIPDKKVAIEYCGLYWHSERTGKDRNYHLSKLKKCDDLGYRLITIFEDEWLNKRDLVLSRLNDILNINSPNVIYGRKCEIEEIPTAEKNTFLNKNHLQGRDIGSGIKLGAYYKDELVSVMTFSRNSLSKNVHNKKDEYELSRFCSKINTRVVGIASKLLRYFTRNYDPKYIFSYADKRWSDGNLYKQLGFSYDHDSAPNYWYLDSTNRVRLHRFNFRKSQLKGMLNYNPNLSEWSIMQKEGYTRIWDCGNIKFRMEFD